MKKLKILRKILISASLFIIVFPVFFLNNDVAVYVNGITNETSESDTTCHATIEDNFDDSSIIVIMDKNYSTPNKVIDKSFFNETKITSITDLTKVSSERLNSASFDEENFMQILNIELSVNDKNEVLSIIKRIEQIEGVYAAEPNYYGSGSALPENSTGNKYSLLWGLHDYNYGIKAPQAWNYSTGSSSVKVAVIDTGVFPHPNLSANLTTGYNFVENNTNTNDTHGHGTHIAGIIGASQNTLNGIVGVCWNVTIVPLKISNDDDWETDEVVEAINWAKNENIPIINFSGKNFGKYALKYAISDYEGLFVTIAGNGGLDEIGDDNDITAQYPSNYSTGENFSNRVISVGAINDNGDLPTFSNWGAETVSIFAPGASILSTVPTTVSSDGYLYKSGTSMAAPFVAGVAALMLSINPNLTPEQIKSTIMNNAMKSTKLTGKCVSGGMLDAYRAVAAVALDTDTIGENIKINGFTSGYIPPQDMDFEIPNLFAQLSSTYGAEKQYVQIIGSSAFSNLTNIKSISLPNTLTNIDSYAFENCSSLQDVDFNNNPDITNIGVGCFEGCSSLESIIIPDTVQYIDSSAFRYCSALTRVIISKENSPITNLGMQAFDNCSAALEIIVPRNRIADYKNASGWSNYNGSIISNDSNYICCNIYSSSNEIIGNNISQGGNILYKLNVHNKESYIISVISGTNTNIKLYNSNFVLIDSNSTTITATLYNDNIYYISLEHSDNATSGIINVNIIKNPNHVHAYDCYIWYNNTKHKKECECGTSGGYEPHVVSQDAFQSGQQYATCLLCGGSASLGFIGTYSESSYPYTTNGSFILPNGVVVLVEGDIYSYIEGTLMFYYPSDNLLDKSHIISYTNKREDDY